MSISDEIARLEDQWRAGTLTDEEFQRAKARVLDDRGPPPPPRSTGPDTNQWAMWLHLSLLAGYVATGVGFLAVVVIWQVKRDEMPGLDPHGKRAVNWLISFAIYFLISFLLTFLIIGIPLLIALGVCGVVFPIIAGLKASKGEVWDYPLAIRFLTD